MARRPQRCGVTPDLLGWAPPAIVPEVPEERVRSASLRGRIAKAVAVALKDCGRPREAVARQMGAYLGEEVSPNSLNAYASEAREEHTISALRLVALCQATCDLRPLQVLAAAAEHAVIPERYLPAIEDALLDDQITELTRRRELARRQWRGPR